MTLQRGNAGAAVAGGDDTIVALATPPGRSAIALVRLSGRGAHDVAGCVVSPWPPVAERTAGLCSLRNPATGALIDRAIVTTYGAGRSYTGEPMVEIATHGGHLVPAMTMAALIRCGAREAMPGEFTRRAVLNGKLDLLRAEAVGDLIDARSGLMHKAALAQLDGGLSQRIEALRQAILETEALIAYDIDFPEEDDGPIDRDRILGSCDAVLERLDALIATAPTGELVREGAIVVLAGAPNAGKSSLYNALLGESRAIVTEIPGTTRDALEATIDADGWPLRLVDTAGLRESADMLERLGIEASERYLARAHVVLACGETTEAVAGTASRVSALTAAPVIGVRTKQDLVAHRTQPSGQPLVANNAKVPPPTPTKTSSPKVSTRDHIGLLNEPSADLVSADYKSPSHDAPKMTSYLKPQSYEMQPHVRPNLATIGDQPSAGRLAGAAGGGMPLVEVSAVTGEGLPELRRAIVAVLAERYGAHSADVPMLTRARHVKALEEARSELGEFRVVWAEAGLPAPVAAVHLREAVVALESLIGAVDVEDVLDRVFSAFCVGK